MNATARRRHGSMKPYRARAFIAALFASYAAGAAASWIAGGPNTGMELRRQTAPPSPAPDNASSDLGNGTIRIVIAPPLASPPVESAEQAPAPAATIAKVKPEPQIAVSEKAVAARAPSMPAPRIAERPAPLEEPREEAVIDTAPVLTPQLKLSMPVEAAVDLAPVDVASADAASIVQPQAENPPTEDTTPAHEPEPQETAPADDGKSGLRRYLFDRIFGSKRIGQ